MMPRSVLQSKMKLATMSGEEIIDYFTKLSKRTQGKTPAELARSAERRHGYRDRPYYSQHFAEYRKFIGDIEKRYQG